MTDTTSGDLVMYLMRGLTFLAGYYLILPEIQEMQQAREQAITECIEINKECLEAVNYNYSQPRCVCYV